MGSNNNGIVRHEIFDGQARKQYLAKAPELNPFGDEETPLRFQDFDVFTKVSSTATYFFIQFNDLPYRSRFYSSLLNGR